MNALIPINYDSDKPTVSARELHGFLEVGEQFSHWFDRMKGYGFAQSADYEVLAENDYNPKGGRPSTDYQLTIDMAKELCMIQRTERGKQARQYFISVENSWNSPEQIMARALKVANAELASLKGENKKLKTTNSALAVDKQIMQPKAEYFDELVDRNLLTNFRDTAKELHIGPKAFVSFLLGRKYLYRDKKGNLKPYADKQTDLFEVKETYNEKRNWRGTQTLVTPKGRETFRLLIAGA